MFTQRVTSSPDFSLFCGSCSEGLCCLEDPESPRHVNRVRSIILLELLALCWLTSLVGKAAVAQEREIMGSSGSLLIK